MLRRKGGAVLAVEYYGWIALASSAEDWTDGDFEKSFSQVDSLLAGFRVRMVMI